MPKPHQCKICGKTGHRVFFHLYLQICYSCLAEMPDYITNRKQIKLYIKMKNEKLKKEKK
jgi:hypothetical protein